MHVIFQEDAKAEQLNEVINKLLETDWYHQAGFKDEEVETYMQTFLKQLNIEEYVFIWTNKQSLKETIENLSFRESTIWEKLKDIPDQLKEKIDANDNKTYLEKLVEFLPEAVFHPAFDNAYKQFKDEKIVQYLTGNAMYLSILICTAQLAGEEKLFEPILRIIEKGHVPVGLKGNEVYLI